MPTCEIIDTFPSFQALWSEVNHEPLDVQIEAWHDRFMSQWPELLQKQLDDYVSLNEDWHLTAAERIFPTLPERLPLMQTAHDNLLNVCNGVYVRCRQVTGFDNDLVCVIYVGLGCGAGWADEYHGKPAILFGLENIAEEGWQEQDALTGLMAHELGHIVHFEWRKQAGLANQEDAWWQLYTEGFAQYCESLISDASSWHIESDLEIHWEEWCQDNLGWLASEFLSRADQGEDMRPFFGSWFDLRGHKQTGYYLGHELIMRLQEKMSLQDVALLSNLENHLRPLLAQMTS